MALFIRCSSKSEDCAFSSPSFELDVNWMAEMVLCFPFKHSLFWGSSFNPSSNAFRALWYSRKKWWQVPFLEYAFINLGSISRH